MMLAIEVMIIIILFSLFGMIHSVLASDKLKIKLVEKTGDKIAFYRLFYNISSILLFGIIWIIAPKPEVIIYDLQNPYDIIIFCLQILSIAGFVWAASYIDLKEFIGLAQVARYMNNAYDTSDLDEKSELVIHGPLKLCRHPVYLFSILFLVLRPEMDLFYLVFVIVMIAYFIVGSYYEERKLVFKYGEAYKEYQQKVSRIFPKIY